MRILKFILFFVVFSCALQAQETYNNPVIPSSLPDPTVIKAADGYFYLYATEDTRNIPIYRSIDLVNWTFVGTAFTNATRPTFEPGGGLWAPDINYINGKYVMYYSMSVWGGEWTCGVGVATADSPQGPFTDRGKLFRSNEINVQNSIDPCYIEDDGKKYLFWGSFRGIYAIELSDDGLSLKEGAVKTQVAGTAFEGTYIFKRAGYYYMFASIGSCCNGVSSTYQLICGRSTDLLQGYVDKNGKSLKGNGYSLVVGSNSKFVGNGHCSEIVQDDEGNYWIFYHGYDIQYPDGRRLFMSRIKWDENGFPYVDGNSPAASAPVPVFRKDAPKDDDVSIIRPYKSTISMPRYGEHTPFFFGFNKYDVLIDSELQGVTLSCPESLGKIVGDKFVATGTESGYITATYNGNITTAIEVNITPVSQIKIRLDSVIIDNRKDYAIEVQANTSAGEAVISSAALPWIVENPEICEVENGVVKALNNGKTMIYGEIDGVRDSILISVEIPATSVIIGDSINPEEWTLLASAFLNAQLSSDNIPLTWDHGAAVDFVYATGRNPYIRLTNKRPFYGLPDTIKMVVNLGDVVVTRAIFSFKANNATTSVTTSFSEFEQNRDFSFSIAVKDLFDYLTADLATYPIWFDYVYFYLESTALTIGNSYSLVIKEIQLVYSNFLGTSIREIKPMEFSVYPNPATDLLFLTLNESRGLNVHTEIYNLSGMLMDARNHGYYSGEKITIPVQNLRAGIYLLKVYDGNRAKVTKFIKK
jgi:arabinan endo-1,5-alpha-L-arabinosidase